MPHRKNANARTTPDVRKAIQESPDSLAVLAARHGINPKTVAKWKVRISTDDLPSGRPATGRGKLTAEQEKVIVQFRERTLLPLDDCLYALQAHIPHLSRSSLHRCLQRHGISRLGEAFDVTMPTPQESMPLGDLHIDLSEVHSNEGSHYLFNAIEQWSKFVFVCMGLIGDADDAADFLDMLVERSPFRINRVFTLAAEPFVTMDRKSAFANACLKHGIEHHLTSRSHPWHRGRGARMGRMVRDNVTFAGEAYLTSLRNEFVHAYNFRRRLKTLRGKTPYEFLCLAWLEKPEQFLRDPHHDFLGLEIRRT